MIIVSWERKGEGYSAESLRELFEKFGQVDAVVINGSKKKGGTVLLMMACKGEAFAAIGSLYRKLSNPLRV